MRGLTTAIPREPDLITCSHDLIACPHDLITCPHDLITCPHDLIACPHDFNPASIGGLFCKLSRKPAFWVCGRAKRARTPKMRNFFRELAAS
jgi:hypothetical protein